MKMKKLGIILFLNLIVMACGVTREAQKIGTETSNSAFKKEINTTIYPENCATFKNDTEKKDLLINYSLYKEPFKAKNYKEAYTYWNYVITNFPGFRQTPFYDGIEMYKSQIGSADAATIKELQNKIMKLYDKLIECHGNAGKVSRLKANAYLKWDKKYGSDHTATITKLYEESLQHLDNAVESSVLKYLWVHYRKDLTRKLKTKEEVNTFGERIIKIAESNIAQNRSVVTFKALKLSVEKVIYPSEIVSLIPNLSTCEGIENYYQKFVEVQDVKQCQQARLRMDKLGCSGPFYTELIKIVPQSPKKIKPEVIAFKEGITLYQQKSFSAAEIKFKEALHLNNNPNFEEQINFYIGNSIYARKNYEDAVPYYENIVASGSKYLSKSYIALGNCYLGAYGKCGTSLKEKAAVAWLAADMFEKAKNDPESASIAQQQFESAREYFLEKGELFMEGIEEGSSIYVACWINKTTTVKGK